MGFFRRWLQNDVKKRPKRERKSNGDCIRKLKKRVG